MTKSVSSIDNQIPFPPEMWRHVLSNLDAQSLTIAERVCKVWQQLADSCWKEVYLRKWPEAKMDKNLSWKQNYKLQHTIDSNIQKKRARVMDLDFVNDQFLPFTICNNKNKLFMTGLQNSLMTTNKIQVWNYVTGKRLQPLGGHTVGVVSLCISNDNLLFSGSMDKMIKVWNAETGDLLDTLEGHEGEVTSLCVSHHQLFSGSSDKTIRIWELQANDLTVRVLKGHETPIKSLCTARTKLISFSMFDFQIKIWNIESGENLQTLQGMAVCASSSKLFYSILEEMKSFIRIFDLEKETHLDEILPGNNDQLNMMSASDGKLFATTGIYQFSQMPNINNNAICIWEMSKNTPLNTLKASMCKQDSHQERPVPVISMHASAGKLFLGYPIGKIRILDFTHSEENQDLDNLPSLIYPK